MSHVVERCPTCGVEHDEHVGGACEACGDTLRTWCRRHGRETGWLPGPACPRCAEEAARPRTAPARRPAPAPAPPARWLEPETDAPPPVRRDRRVPAPGGPPPLQTRIMEGLMRAGAIAGLSALSGFVMGLLYALTQGADLIDTPRQWGLVLALLGGVIGTSIGLVHVVDPPRRRR